MTALATIHIGLKQLGIVEEDARDLYERLTGERSLRAMRPDQHQALIDELIRLGFKPISKRSRKSVTGIYAAKLQALWISAWNLGLIRQRDDQALVAFVKRQTGIDHTRFLHYSTDADRVIEALKKWMTRDGGVDWSRSSARMPHTQAEGYRIASAQWQKLTGGDFIAPAFWAGVASILGRNPTPINPPSKREWIAVMNELGRRVRALKVEAGAENRHRSQLVSKG